MESAKNLIHKWHEVLDSDDLNMLDSILADDAVFSSPVVFTPMEGKEITKMYLHAAGQSFNMEKFQYTKEIHDGNILNNFKIIFIVSLDININDNIDLLWGIFTRFDPTLDIVFKNCELTNSSVQFSGTMIVDATQKDWYPKVLSMNDDIVDKVDRNWKIY